jgi:hypothetical protein
LEIVLILKQDRCMGCTDRPIGSKIILARPMELLGDVVKWKLAFSLLGDSVNLSIIYLHGMCRMHHGHRNLFGHTR